MPSDGLYRRSLAGLVPYEPGKPAEDVQRELGLERVVKLASNEGQFGPFPAALEAIERGARSLNRYPDPGAYRLREALARKHDVPPARIAIAAGADAVIMYLAVATLEPGDEVVCGWPSFPSYTLDAGKVGAEARTVPLADGAYDPLALLAALSDRTKLVFLCNPNNPTGKTIRRGALDAYFEQAPEYVLTVLDEAYFEYVEEPDYPDGIETYVKAGRRVLVLRTFSKIYGLAGLRVGYGVGPEDVVQAIAKVRNAFDVSQTAQDAAVASLGDTEEVERRRRVNAEARAGLCEGLERLGLPYLRPPAANFVYVDVGGDSRALYERLVREGVIVRPLGPFGAPSAVRVTVGTPEENAVFLEAMARLLAAAPR
jgi:histidinol-phosphate aminotransferase